MTDRPIADAVAGTWAVARQHPIQATLIGKKSGFGVDSITLTVDTDLGLTGERVLLICVGMGQLNEQATVTFDGSGTSVVSAGVSGTGATVVRAQQHYIKNADRKTADVVVTVTTPAAFLGVQVYMLDRVVTASSPTNGDGASNGGSAKEIRYGSTVTVATSMRIAVSLGYTAEDLAPGHRQTNLLSELHDSGSEEWRLTTSQKPFFTIKDSDIVQSVELANASISMSGATWAQGTPPAAPLWVELVDRAGVNFNTLIASSEEPSADRCSIQVAPGTDPHKSTNHEFFYWYRRSETGSDKPMTLTVEAREGEPGTVRGGRLHTAIDTDWTLASVLLTGAQADAIADYSDLHISFTADTP